MGRTWPSEKQIILYPVTGLPLTFLTSTDGSYRQSKIYQTHRQWTADGKWLIFRGVGETGPQAMGCERRDRADCAGDESGFMDMLCAWNNTMKLNVMTLVGAGGRGRWRVAAPGAGEGACGGLDWPAGAPAVGAAGWPRPRRRPRSGSNTYSNEARQQKKKPSLESR